jgi:hypothetical protein
MKNETAQQFVQRCYDKITVYVQHGHQEIPRVTRDVMREVHDRLEEQEKQIAQHKACLDSWKGDEGADARRFAWLMTCNVDSRADLTWDMSREAVDQCMAVEAADDER